MCGYVSVAEPAWRGWVCGEMGEDFVPSEGLRVEGVALTPGG